MRIVQSLLNSPFSVRMANSGEVLPLIYKAKLARKCVSIVNSGEVLPLIYKANLARNDVRMAFRVKV